MDLRTSTRRIRLAASPMVVAVALGLLGPSVLEEEDATLSSWEPQRTELPAQKEEKQQD